jgi:sugar phosphate isomerase/epimerase
VIAISTSWNAPRHAGWTDAVRELARLGHRHVALDGAALHADAADAAAALRETRGKVVALFAPASEDGSVPTLCAPPGKAARVAIKAALAAGRAAEKAGTSRVVLRGPRLPSLDDSREAAWREQMQNHGAGDTLRADVRRVLTEDQADRERCLESLCRSLHELIRARPDTHWLVETPSTPVALPLPEEAEMLFAEFPQARLGYWHDSGNAARLAVLGAASQDEWLGRLGRVARGVTLADWSPIADRMPPGSGHVQWRALRFQVSDGMHRVLALDPEYPAALIDDTLREVGNLGF